mgnify:CR=1 FL=1
MGREIEIGEVVKFFTKPSVAAIQITAENLKIGDILHYFGHTTDFREEILSMQIDNQNVQEANAGDTIGIKVKERVREHDKVFKVTP